MENEKKRIINYRPILLFFLGVVSGILLISNYIFSFDIGLSISLQVVVYGFYFLLLIYVIIDSIRNKKLNKRFKVLIILIISTLLGASSFFCYYEIGLKSDITTGTYTCTARVEEVYVKYDKPYLYLSDITMNETKVNGNMLLRYVLSNSDEIGVGDKISFTGKVIRVDDFDKVVDGTLYSMSLYSSITITGNDKNMVESIRDSVKEKLLSEMTADTAGVCYAVVLGNKHLISSDTILSFSLSGIGHILAVSGLHIMILVGVLDFCLKKLKLNSKVSAVIMTLILLFYNILCGFTPSVVRASIMSIVLVLSKLTGKQYDSLNSLSFAGIIILLSMPYELFSIGFIMSMISVFSIITLAKYIYKVLTLAHFPKYLASTLSVSLSVNIGLSIVMINYFGFMSITAIFTNLIVLPIFYFAYIFLFVAIFISYIWSKVLLVPYAMFHLIKLIAENISGIGVVSVRSFGVWAIAILLLVLYIINFVMIKPRLKSIVCGVLIIIMGVFGIMNNIPSVGCSNVAIMNSDTKAVIVVSPNKSISIVNITDNYDLYAITEYLESNRMYKVDSVVYYDSLVSENKINKFIKKYKVDNIFSNCYNGKCNNISIDAGTRITSSGVTIDIIGENDNIYGTKIVTNNNAFAVLKNIDALQIDYVNDSCDNLKFVLGYYNSKLSNIKADDYYVYGTSAKTDYQVLDQNIKVDL